MIKITAIQTGRVRIKESQRQRKSVGALPPAAEIEDVALAIQRDVIQRHAAPPFTE